MEEERWKCRMNGMQEMRGFAYGRYRRKWERKEWVEEDVV
jgi:hypothetical protein